MLTKYYCRSVMNYDDHKQYYDIAIVNRISGITLEEGTALVDAKRSLILSENCLI